MDIRFASADREAFRELNEAAHNARRVAGSDHPEYALIMQIMRLTDELVDRTAPAYPLGSEGMTRDEAQRLLKETPEFVPGPCPRCGVTTFEEAATKCRPFQMPCGDYSCGSPDEGPNAENETGPLYQRNPDYDEMDGYLWGWFAVDEGYTKTPPTWRGEESR